jgi:ubiquinone/menaquinone biosynthesis C-methylase UbiE
VYLQRWALGPPDKGVFRQVDFLIGQLNAYPGKSLIDVACGHGRYSLAFAARGLYVTGLDASAVLLREARKFANEAGISVNWMLGDMRRLPATEAYNYGLLLDSFGFFESDEENEDVIRQLRLAVAPGGRIVIAVVNGTKILENFGPVVREEHEGRIVEIRRELQADRRVLREEVVVIERGERHASERRQRLYSATEIADIVAGNGFRCRQLYGDMLGDSFSEGTSWKIVMICERIDEA